VTEGRQTEGGERDARARENVVRLPLDWLGPREELVPFGPRAAAQTTGGGTVPSDESPPRHDFPPSAEDFWGERSAAIHHALQAPADEPAPVGVAGTRRPRRTRRRLDRRLAAAAAGSLAVAAVVVFAVSSSFSGHGRPAGGSKVGVAAVFGSGVSRLMQLGLAALDINVPRTLPRLADSRGARRRPHHPAARRTHPSAPKTNRRQVPQVHSTTPVSIETSHAVANYDAPNHVDTTPTYRPVQSPQPSQPDASSATVSATGESGALGPIQSPNG
jgi:hypothetical protein